MGSHINRIEINVPVAVFFTADDDDEVVSMLTDGDDGRDDDGDEVVPILVDCDDGGDDAVFGDLCGRYNVSLRF